MEMGLGLGFRLRGAALALEIVVDGGFDAGIVGWAGHRSATVALDAGRLKVTSGAQSFGGAQYSVIGRLVDGASYTLTLTITADAAVNARAFIGAVNASGNLSGGTQITAPAGTSAVRTLVFTASAGAAAGGYIIIGHDTSTTTAGRIAFADNVSLKRT